MSFRYESSQFRSVKKGLISLDPHHLTGCGSTLWLFQKGPFHPQFTLLHGASKLVAHVVKNGETQRLLSTGLLTIGLNPKTTGLLIFLPIS